MIETALVMKASHQVAKYLVSRTGNYEIALSFAMKAVWSVAKRVEASNERRVAKGNSSLVKTPNVKLYFAKAMSAVRKSAAYDFIFGVPTWIIRENEVESGLIINWAVSAETVKETEKAVQITFNVDRPKDHYESTRTIWVPKSVMAA